MFFLRRLKSFNVDIRILTNFYKCVIKSILTYSIIIWYKAVTKKDIKKINSVISTASYIIGRPIHDLSYIYNNRILKKSKSISQDETHIIFLMFYHLDVLDS